MVPSMEEHRYTDDAYCDELADEYLWDYEPDEDDLENEWYRQKEHEYHHRRQRELFATYAVIQTRQRVFACAGQRHRGRSSVRPSSRRTRGTRRIRKASSSSTDPSGDPEPEGVGRSKDLTRAGAPARASEYRAHSGPTAAGARVVLPVHVAVRPETRLASRGPEVFSRRHP